MWSLFDVVSADIAPEPSASDIGGLVALIAFCAFFVILGGLYLKKKRSQRISDLARELDTPGLSTDRALPAQGGADVVPSPSSSTPAAEPAGPNATDLVAAEREAQLRRAEADAAARAAARAEAAAAAANDDVAKAKAQDAKDKAKAAEDALAKAGVAP